MTGAQQRLNAYQRWFSDVKRWWALMGADGRLLLFL
jgi:hypothetical protein